VCELEAEVERLKALHLERTQESQRWIEDLRKLAEALGMVDGDQGRYRYASADEMVQQIKSLRNMLDQHIDESLAVCEALGINIQRDYDLVEVAREKVAELERLRLGRSICDARIGSVLASCSEEWIHEELREARSAFRGED
jgi:hypothetical protein